MQTEMEAESGCMRRYDFKAWSNRWCIIFSLILGHSDLRGEFFLRKNSKPLKYYAPPALFNNMR